MANPSHCMRLIHVKLHAVALRRLNAERANKTRDQGRYLAAMCGGV